MSLRATVLGGAGAAPLEGACSSYHLAGEGTSLLLDCGPGTLERLWRRELLADLDAIVISHMHADHILDLLMVAGEAGSAAFEGRRPRLLVPTGGAAVLRSLDSVFSGGEGDGPTRFEAAFELSEYSPDARLEVGRLALTFAATAHRGLCCAIRVSDGGAAVVYGADGSPSEALEQLAGAADLLILEATYAEDTATASSQGHMTALQAGALASRAGAQRLVLTHLIPGDHDRLLALARAEFPGEVALAREGLSYELG
jgi:ribonuclease BN (tRNA processing enzyme)